MNSNNGFNLFMQHRPPPPQMNFPPRQTQNFRPQNQITRPRFGSATQKHLNLDSPENVKKEIVIFNLSEPIGTANPEIVDLQIVQQILSAIIGVQMNIKIAKRMGNFNPEKPRRILVLFHTSKDQQIAITNAEKLNNFPGWKHLDIQPYRPFYERNDNGRTRNKKEDPQKPAKTLPQKIHELTILSNPFANFASADASVTPKEVNILIIGATGVGKSTWINGIANYMNFDTFDDALNAKKPVCLIPMSFKLFGDEQTSIKMLSTIGERDKNEAESRKGQSCTQEPKVYRYITDTVAFNLIDTPGICDTRGVEADIMNIQMIMECMTLWDEIHGICLLLKPDQHRLVHPFRYCIQELLINLHKNSIPNISVVFTNASSTFYRPAGTMDVLTTLFENVKTKTGCSILLEDENTFCIENEAVKILYAKHKGIKVDKNIIDNVSHSWDHTVKETYRLFKYFNDMICMVPHITYETKATTKVRGTLTELSKILANINEEIMQTRIVHDEQNKQLKVLQENLKNRQNVTFQGEYIENTPLSYPITVCCGQNCFETIKALSSEVPDKFFKQPCCSPCPLRTIIPDNIGHVNLRQCEAFGSNGCCKTCGCSWQLHKHFWYSQKKIMGNFSSSINQENIDILNIQIAAKTIEIQKSQISLQSLEQYVNKVTKLCYPYFEFLTQNSIITFNDAFEEYVTLGIKEIEKFSKIGDDQTKLNNLNKLLAAHQQIQCTVNSQTNSAPNLFNGIDQRITLYNYMDHISNLNEIIGFEFKLISSHYQSQTPSSKKIITCETKVKQIHHKNKAKNLKERAIL
jgi:predicted GTPase/uncharacterized coiled-coil protein SlyX